MDMREGAWHAVAGPLGAWVVLSEELSSFNFSAFLDKPHIIILNLFTGL